MTLISGWKLIQQKCTLSNRKIPKDSSPSISSHIRHKIRGLHTFCISTEIIFLQKCRHSYFLDTTTLRKSKRNSVSDMDLKMGRTRHLLLHFRSKVTLSTKRFVQCQNNIRMDYFKFCDLIHTQMVCKKNIFLGTHFDYSYGVLKNDQVVSQPSIEPQKTKGWTPRSTPRFYRNSAPKFSRHSKKE